jgi:hypothetical protein
LILLSFACSFGKEAFSEKAMPTEAEAIQTPQAAATQADTESIQPLYFFYAIHTHTNGDYLPYT